jgi:hypothetical protein
MLDIKTSSGGDSNTTSFVEDGGQLVAFEKATTARHPGENELNDVAIFDAAAAASLVIANWERSVLATIDACIHVHHALVNFRNEFEQLRVFKEKLVEASIISVCDESLESGSKLSKLARIGREADLLRDKRILRFIEAGYSVLYEVVLLFEALPKATTDRETTIDELAARLESIVKKQGVLRRRDIEAEKRAVRRTPPRATSGAKANGASLSSSDHVGADTDVDQHVGATRLPGFLLITPSTTDMRILAQDYAETGTLSRCLQVDSFGQPDRAVVITTISDLATIRTRLLPLFGLNTLSHAILLEQPDQPDILNARVAVVADRRAAPKSSASPLRKWLPKECAADAVAIAERFWDGSTDKAHLFAAKATDGWQCSIGDSAWKEKPSL